MTRSPDVNELESSPMQTKRLVIWVIVSLLFVVSWSYIQPRPVRAPAPAATAAGGSAPATESPVASAPSLALEAPAAEAAPGAGTVAAIDETERRRVVAETPAWSVEMTNVGGRLTSWKLLAEQDHGDPTRPLELVRRRAAAGSPSDAGISDDQDVLPLQVVTGDAALDARLARALHAVSSESRDGRRILTARWSDGAGTSVEKILTLRESPAIATLEARLTVGGRPAPLRLAWGPGISNHGDKELSNLYFRRGQVSRFAAGKVREIERADKQGELPETPVRWAAIQDSYFAVAFTPLATADSPTGRETDGAATGFRVGGVLPMNDKGKPDKTKWPEEITLEVPFTPDAPVQAVVVGPRDRAALRELDGAFRSPPGLWMLTHLGMLDGLARLLHVPMLKFHAWTGSWGWSVILLTLLVRIVIGPLQFMSMKKMRGMQEKMQPVQAKVKALDERYKKLPPTRENRMKQMQEKQELMMAAGINPADTLSGCLPLLITMPVFFALLKLLPNAPEFRHEPFLFWNDLAAADPSHVLPFLAALLTLVSTKMGMSSSTQSIDPMQRNMLYMFPLMLVWLCWSAPLAFVVYQVAMSAVQIGQQQLFNLALKPAVPESAARERTGKLPGPTEKSAGAPTGPVAGTQGRKKGRKR
jgi:YidC/Oxa1 family membrane protein insertase